MAPVPARDYAEALAGAERLRARDGPAIGSPGRSRFYGHGRRTRLAVVLIHGLTNCPQQWETFATGLHEAGHTVVIPRLPGHGHFYRATRAPARVRGVQLLAAVHEAVDIARGAGERVALAGLSIGGAIAPHVALARGDVDHAIAIVPFFAPARLDAARTRRLVWTLERIPNFFVPWDPGGDGSQIPSYGYPRFATRLLAESLRIALDVYDAAQERAPAGRTTFVLNACEPAVNNGVSLAVRDGFERARAGSSDLVVLEGLPANHDIVDPTNPRARTDLVYPALRSLIERS